MRRFFERIEQKDAELFDGKLIDFEAEIIEYRAMYYITNITTVRRKFPKSAVIN